MKIVFLDVDGVLNCYNDFVGKDTFLILNKQMIKRLNRIIKSTGADIVLSSTWRMYPQHIDYLREHGVNFIDSTIIGSFPWSSRQEIRGNEIQHWLNKNKVESYVILDDNWDFLEHQKPFVILTKWLEGLQDKHVRKAVKILGRSK